ncbi:hypothetical protein okayama9524_05410 [Yersinia pseudotuberculosis]
MITLYTFLVNPIRHCNNESVAERMKYDKIIATRPNKHCQATGTLEFEQARKVIC